MLELIGLMVVWITGLIAAFYAGFLGSIYLGRLGFDDVLTAGGVGIVLAIVWSAFVLGVLA